LDLIELLRADTLSVTKYLVASERRIGEIRFGLREFDLMLTADDVGLCSCDFRVGFSGIERDKQFACMDGIPLVYRNGGDPSHHLR
jgi:hypothetical protein